MKKTSLKNLDLNVYEETLKNGLKVVLVPCEDKKEYMITYATKFGSNTTTFTPIGSKKKVKVPDGIAHFLEHKMFEQKSGEDPFKFFSKTGTSVNASTSYDNTRYYCYGTKSFEENLKYLIDFVNEPYYTDENVEKEKGIIAEEIKMYLDRPDVVLDRKLKENTYKYHPIRVDIGGSIEEIKKITKEDLYLCYSNFYTPSNMFILIVGKFNIETALDIIKSKFKDEVQKRTAKPLKIKEPDFVFKKNEIIKSSIEVPKVGISYKIPKSSLTIKNKEELDLYLVMLISLLFGSSSDFQEEITKSELATNFYMDIEDTKDHKTFVFTASTKKEEKLISKVDSVFKTVDISEEEFERKKKVWIANEVKLTDYVNPISYNIYDDLIRYDKVIYNRVDLIRKMKLSKLKEIISSLNLKEKATVIMLNSDKKEV